MTLNVNSVIEASQAAVPHIEAQGGGSIINVGSIAGNNGGGPGSGALCRRQGLYPQPDPPYGQGPRRPRHPRQLHRSGRDRHPFHDATPPERMEAMRKEVQLGRIGTPEDCVGPVLFLASSDMSAYVTGQILHINGGQLMP